MTNTLEKMFENIRTLSLKRNAERAEFLQTQSPSKPCPVHSGVVLMLDPDNTRLSQGTWEAAYQPCPRCVEARLLERQNEILREAGVPKNLLHCTLGGWEPETAQDEVIKAKVAEFAALKKGFLFLIGHEAVPERNVGCGKSHLGVALMRAFRSPRFTKQGTFLLGLRAGYKDKKAEDVIEACKDADLLVLDEVGLSGGGKDELPALHEVLDHRYGEELPTVITSNLDWPGIKGVFGPRLADRFNECGIVLTFAGASHRRSRRDLYLKPQPTQTELKELAA